MIGSSLGSSIWRRATLCVFKVLCSLLCTLYPSTVVAKKEDEQESSTLANLACSKFSFVTCLDCKERRPFRCTWCCNRGAQLADRKRADNFLPEQHTRLHSRVLTMQGDSALTEPATALLRLGINCQRSCRTKYPIDLPSQTSQPLIL